MNIYDECREFNSIAITGHIKPDGDCIGSTIALFLYLKKRLPNAAISVMLEELGECFSYIPEVLNLNTSFELHAQPEVVIVVDTSSERIGSAEAYYKKAVKTINIDHHISNASGCAMVNMIDPSASSASEMVGRLVEEEYMDEPIARLLYLGIVHDTGVFKYSNTSPETLQMAARLITYGFDFSELIDKTFYEKTYRQNIAIGRIILESRLFLDNKLIIGFMDLHTMTQMGLTSNDFDGVINQLRITQGVECAAFIYQMNHCTYKVSLRSNGMVDVAKVAQFFNGGGHQRASGFYTKGEPKAIIETLTRQIEIQLLRNERVC